MYRAIINLCTIGHEQCLQTLLKFGCNITQRDEYGDTPERVAERHNNGECVKIIKEFILMNSDK